MADFTLDTSTLAGEAFKVVPLTDMNGEFRDIQFHISQATAGADMELHYFELHYTIAGVSQEDL